MLLSKALLWPAAQGPMLCGMQPLASPAQTLRRNDAPILLHCFQSLLGDHVAAEVLVRLSIFYAGAGL